MKFITERIRSIFILNDSPHKLASAFALGVFIAFSPTLGLHTISCLVLAWIFRLNKFVVFTAAMINNPWTIVPMFGSCLWFGTKLVGSEIAVPEIAWNEITFENAYIVLKPYLLPFVAGTVVIGLAAAAVTYALIYWAVVKRRERRAVPAISTQV